MYHLNLQQFWVYDIEYSNKNIKRSNNKANTELTLKVKNFLFYFLTKTTIQVKI